MAKKIKLKQWMPGEIRGVLPLVGSILRTIREQSLCNNAALCRMKKSVSARELVYQQEIADKAAHAILEALGELEDLSVFCADPVQAIAAFAADGPSQAVPWVFFELYSEKLYWRYETDPEGMQRDFAEIEFPI